MRNFEAEYAAVILPIAHLTIHPHDKKLLFTGMNHTSQDDNDT
jgi:hypothetical protein